ncbi:ATP-dependent zinc protease family protein [Teredinibacter purpureus]|uniref:ATP-dependent zinc protease family protein n=1 Tax=Teredinibacter purpureus TaxID=2731756 RepID=UPI0005F896D5|nr:RimK/LysX family protein [Teredinibacter purpureus]
MSESSQKLLVGALEYCDLPELEISRLTIRVDTGAQTSSLHVDNIVEFDRNDRRWVSFDIHPDIHDVAKVLRREAKVKAERTIKSSNGTKQKRYVIDTLMMLGGLQWRIQLSLTDRSGMTYLMLLGREAMEQRILVDPSEEYLLSK